LFLCVFFRKFETGVDMADNNELKGALKECIRCFPKFYDDFDVLLSEGYMQMTSPETCKWLKSSTSLAQYFKWTDKGVKRVSGGFWDPIEKTFGIKRHTLRKLQGRNGNDFKLDESIDFSKLKPILEEKRYQKDLLKLEKVIFDGIKYFVIMAEQEKPESIHFTLEKTKKLISILNNFTDKND